MNNRDAFFGAIAEVERFARAGHSPVLHLETHGDETGLQLANGERIQWLELAAPLASLNQATAMNLTVFVAACDGAHLISVLRPTGRAPAWAIIGPKESVSHEVIEEATKSFYVAFLSSPDLRTALEAMNASVAIPDWRFRIEWAETMFCSVFKAYLREAGSDASVAQRVNSIAGRAGRDLQAGIKESITIRFDVQKVVGDHEARYAQYRRCFLMLDAFPENAGRFTMTYDRCKRVQNL